MLKLKWIFWKKKKHFLRKKAVLNWSNCSKRFFLMCWIEMNFVFEKNICVSLYIDSFYFHINSRNFFNNECFWKKGLENCKNSLNFKVCFKKFDMPCHENFHYVKKKKNRLKQSSLPQSERNMWLKFIVSYELSRFCFSHSFYQFIRL